LDGLCEAIEGVRLWLSVSGVALFGASVAWGGVLLWMCNCWRGGSCAAKFCACLQRRLLSVLETGPAMRAASSLAYVGCRWRAVLS